MSVFPALGVGSIFRSLSQLSGQCYFVDVFVQKAFDIAEIALLFFADESDGNPVVVGAGGTADAVDVILVVVGNIVIDDQPDVVYVNAPGHNVRCYEYVDMPALNWYITSSRCACSRSECISPTFSFICLSAFVTSLTFSLEDAKMMTRSGTCSANRWRMIPSFWFS